MSQYPLLDLTRQFAQDVQAVYTDFQASVMESGSRSESDLPQRLSDILDETAQEKAASASAEKKHKSGSGATAGTPRPEATVAASPLKCGTPKMAAAFAFPASPIVAPREGSWPPKKSARLAEPVASAPIETVQAAPRPQVGLLAAAANAGAAASPRQGAQGAGGLLDKMRARGTFGFGAASPLHAAPPNSSLVPAASKSRSSSESLDAGHDGDTEQARRPSGTAFSPAGPGRGGPLPEFVRAPAPKRPRENSVVAMYKALVEPTLLIGNTLTPLKGKVASAKKFRRSSMLKQAAAVAAREIPAAAAGLSLDSPRPTGPAAGKMGAPAVAGQASSSSASSTTVPGRAINTVPDTGSAILKPVSSPKPAATGSGGKRIVKKAPRPPVPAFSAPPAAPVIQPYQMLRQRIPLSPKKDDDNYEMSEKDENSDNDQEEPDRTHKHVPKWCTVYLETLSLQTSWDPDSIFGSKVPRCDLDSIFSIETYKKYSRERPQRRRGSSGEWKKDRLRQNEIRDYKKKMGQTKRWSASLKTVEAPAAAAH